jgi:DNA-binding transcriptional regulator YiaG
MPPSGIRRLRKRLGLSPEDFAAYLGFTGDHARITVWRWETGRRRPSAQTIALMKQLLTKKPA